MDVLLTRKSPDPKDLSLQNLVLTLDQLKHFFCFCYSIYLTGDALLSIPYLLKHMLLYVKNQKRDDEKLPVKGIQTFHRHGAGLLLNFLP